MTDAGGMTDSGRQYRWTVITLLFLIIAVIAAGFAIIITGLFEPDPLFVGLALSQVVMATFGFIGACYSIYKLNGDGFVPWGGSGDAA